MVAATCVCIGCIGVICMLYSHLKLRSIDRELSPVEAIAKTEARVFVLVVIDALDSAQGQMAVVRQLRKWAAHRRLSVLVIPRQVVVDPIEPGKSLDELTGLSGLENALKVSVLPVAVVVLKRTVFQAFDRYSWSHLDGCIAELSQSRMM